ncbi:MAG: TIGR03960 family B12-binding radical SAM protein [candidate division Zixibacteria bacterium]|nr:TIGR03960 family B12-binding radical SAM protein [candidate division Zixibacteria bacterium]
MRHLLEKKFFPYVNKPGRYIGGELGIIVKDPKDRLKMALGYPDMYEIGMSYLGTQILYNLINSDDRFLCERFYAPDKDAEEVLRRDSIPLFSLESFRPLKEFDLIGFTVAYEMVYSNLLNILNLSGLPLRSADREENHPLIIAGGPVVHNPEPIAPFIDLFYIGDAEDNIIKILESLYNGRGLSKSEKLERIVREVPSLYVPRFYDSTTHLPLTDFAPPKIQSHRIKTLKNEYYPKRPLVPFIETVHDRLSAEIMRGCPRGCRFCQATAIYRPVRLRPKDEIIAQVHDQIDKTGFDEVTLLSLSSSDYPDIFPLATQLSRELYDKKVALSMPSMRPGTLTPELANSLKLTRKTGLTFAPEAGTQRLRDLIRKNITEHELYDTIRLAFENGWTTVKLYFMIGLPTETMDDIKGILQMIRNVSNIARTIKGKNSINVTISPFSPKSHTPFQWDEQPSPDSIREKSDFIRKNANSQFVNIKLRDPHLAFLEGVLGRGGQELATVIETAYRKGARFDGWTEGFDFELWLNAFRENNIDPYIHLREKPFSESLPWSHIELDISVEHLIQERNRTSALLKEVNRSTEAIAPIEETKEDDDSAFGRSPKKSIQKTSVAPTRTQVRVKWGRQGLVRFLSHLDNIRAIERSIRRSGLPVEYTQGFHPHMKISYGPPLPLGFTSEAEYFDLSLEKPFQPEMAARLSAALPDGFFLNMTKPIINLKESLSSRLNRAVYRVSMAELPDTAEKLASLLSLEKVEAIRVAKEERRLIDIRPAIFKLEYRKRDATNSEIPKIYMELGLGNAGYARPQEVMLAAGLCHEEELPALAIHRQELLYIDSDGRRLSPMEF